jgi:hypothetical protein
MYIYRLDEMATKGSNLSKYQSTTCSLLDLSSLAISTSVIVPTSYSVVTKRTQTLTTSTSIVESTPEPAKRPIRKTHKTSNLNLRQLSQQSVTRKPDHTSLSVKPTDVDMSESSSA